MKPWIWKQQPQFVGGFGVNSVLFYEFSTPGTNPLDPENPIILGAGPLVGTLVPGASRIMATTNFRSLVQWQLHRAACPLAPYEMGWGTNHIVILARLCLQYT